MGDHRLQLLSRERILSGEAATELDELIAKRVREHALALYDSIHEKLEDKKTDFRAVRTWQVIVLELRTFLGDNKLFWNPLVTELFITPPARDDKVWDVLIPIGFKHLRKVKTSIPFTHEEIEL